MDTEKCAECLKNLLNEWPGLIPDLTDEKNIEAVLSDLRCSAKTREMLWHLLQCGMGGILTNRPDRLSSAMVQNLITEMEDRYYISPKYSLEGIRFWTLVYDIPVEDGAMQCREVTSPIESEKSEAVVSPSAPPQPEIGKSEPKPRGETEERKPFLKIKDMHWKAWLLLSCGVLLVIYHIFCFGKIRKFELEYLAVDAILIICAGLYRILRTGLSPYIADQKGKYGSDWQDTLIVVLSAVYFFLTLYRMVQLEDNSLLFSDSDQFYLLASMFLVAGYGLAMTLLRIPKVKKSSI